MDLDSLIIKAEKLQSILRDNPEIGAFAKELHTAKEPVMIMEHDRLVRAKEASRILNVNEATIGKYVASGKLKAWYLPDTRQRRFKVSDLWKLAEVKI